MESSGTGSADAMHLEGMLDRDQRTAKCVFGHHHHQRQNKAISHHHPSNLISTKRSTIRSWTILMPLRHTLIVGTCISLLAFPIVSTAPTQNMDEKNNERWAMEPSWHNPCDLAAGSTNNVAITADANKIRDTVRHALSQSRTALFQANYLRKTYFTTLVDSVPYPWLPSVPKDLGDDTSQSHLDALEFREEIKAIYTNLSILAVALEQIVWDKEDMRANPSEVNDFKNMYGSMKPFLCEVYLLMKYMDVPLPEQVQREHMDPAQRSPGDTTMLQVRHGNILKVCINVIEYVRDVLQHEGA